jgi:hypothetical protein
MLSQPDIIDLNVSGILARLTRSARGLCHMSPGLWRL